MDLEQRLSNLERHHDWPAVAEALEQAIASAPDASAKAVVSLSGSLAKSSPSAFVFSAKRKFKSCASAPVRRKVAARIRQLANRNT